MELQSRLVFIDTNVYEGKNFQFLTHSLGALKRLIDEGQVRLLVTEITKGEVFSHIKKKAAAAVLELKSIKKKAMILRNLPSSAAYGIFSDVSAEEIAETIITSFEEFLNSEHVEVVSIDDVRPSYVFERYFSSRAPFAIGEKEKEFADAFVLKALDDFSSARGHPIHIISTDKDMSRYADDHPSLVYTESIDAFIDAVNKSISIIPSAFAAQALEHVMPEIMELIKDGLNDMQEDFHLDSWATELESVRFSEIELVSADLIRVDHEECNYVLKFGFVAEVVEIEKDYDRSPFDHEDDSYPFVLENVLEKTYDAQVVMDVVLSYQDNLINTVEIFDCDPPTRLKLSSPYNETVTQLDINGE